MLVITRGYVKVPEGNNNFGGKPMRKTGLWEYWNTTKDGFLCF